ncbi:MAG: MFS transporter [Spirochaetia bacterium]|nr:MFS transporter [Spirochaetia bacterium]
MNETKSFARQLAVIGLGYFCTGITIPALSLVITSKGFSLLQLSSAMLCYSVTTILLEVPSGIFCDAKGRRSSYGLGLVFAIVSTACLFSPSFWLLCVGFALGGFGRAFSSGSLDALVIEDYLHGGGSMGHVVMWTEIISDAALGIGALAGGLLLAVGKDGPHLTDVLLGVRVFLLSVCLLLLRFWVRKDRGGSKEYVGFSAQARLVTAKMHTNGIMVWYLFFTLLLGFQLASLESYWQPYLKSLLSASSEYWILGVIGASIFLVSVIGSVAGKFFQRYGRLPQLLLLSFGIAFLLELSLPYTKTLFIFCIPYVLIYFNLGVASVVGGCLFNGSLDDAVRSSSLSLNSFALQFGAVLSNLFAMAILHHGTIVTLWISVSLICCFSLVAGAIPFIRVASEQQDKSCSGIVK